MSRDNQDNRFFLSIIKSAILSIFITLSCVLIFAIAVKLAGLGANVIKLINQFFKVISIFIGCFFNIGGKLGYLKGALSGLLYSVVIYLIFSLLGGLGIVFTHLLIDGLFASVIGAISGVVAVNRKSNS